MKANDFVKSEMAAAVDRGVRQCVLIGERSPEVGLWVFSIDESGQPDQRKGAFISTGFGAEPLPRALSGSRFDALKASFFIWLGDAGYRTVDAAMATFSFIASLPAGTGVVFDYAVERSSVASLVSTALDGLASRITLAGENVKHYIDPRAVAALLRGLGFSKVADLPHEEMQASGHLVSAVV